VIGAELPAEPFRGTNASTEFVEGADDILFILTYREILTATLEFKKLKFLKL
jgi:hypothetical protein